MPLASISRVWTARRRPSWALLALCVVPNVVEAVVVVVVGPAGAAPMATQVSAPPPFGVFHDLRWLAVYHRSWPAFGVEAAALVVVRGVLTGLAVGLAWPHDVERASWSRLLVRGAVATVVLGALLAPAAAMLFGLALVPVSWLFFVAVPMALLVGVVAHPLAVRRGWWHRGIPLRSIGAVVATFFFLCLASLAAAPAPAWLVPVVAAAAGIGEAWAWEALVRPIARQRAGGFVPVVALGIILLAGLVVGGAALGFERARDAEASSPRQVPAAQADNREGKPVLVVSGYGSRWPGTPVHPLPGDFYEVQFSYRGLSPDGTPLAYDGADTAKPLTELIALMAEQVSALHEATGRQVAIVAESEGALVAKLYLEVTPDAPVSTLVMASPLLAPGRVSYPPVGQVGWGVVTRDGLSSISAAFQPLAPIDLSPQSPFLLSIDEAAPLLRPLLACPLPGVRQFALLPLADAVASPEAPALPFPSAVVAAFHGGLITRAPSDALIATVLRRGTLEQRWWWQAAEHVVRWGAAAWQVPALDVGAEERRLVGPLPTCTTLANDLSRLRRPEA